MRADSAAAATTTIAETSSPTFSGFYRLLAINTAGTVVFQASFDACGIGIYLGDGGAGTEVIGSGDTLFGSTVTNLSVGRLALNDAGQHALKYTLADTSVSRNEWRFWLDRPVAIGRV